MKTYFLFFIVLSAIIPVTSQASEIEFSKYKIEGFRLTNKILSTEGHFRYFNADEALQYCKDIGGTLPTARQYAKLGIQLGAKGMRETSYPNRIVEDLEVQNEIKKMRADGYEPVKKFWVHNGEKLYMYAVIDFYYNFDGFPEYSSDFGADSLWTFSGTVDDRHQQYIFNGPDGSFGDQFAPGKNLVRCLLQ